MKLYKKGILLLAAALFVAVPSCKKFDSININPNSPENVSSNYILTYVLTETSKLYYNLGAEGSKISGLLQYNQIGTNENAAAVNNYGWDHDPWDSYYAILRNTKIINTNAIRDNNKLFEGISLIMKSFVFGLLTDLYGDIPYSEALNASGGTYFPKYDKQVDVYAGILRDLSKANTLLSNLDATKDAIDAGADVIYAGKGDKWRMFANSLRLRYSMRLLNKKAEMTTAGVNIVDEFNSAAGAAFTSIDNEATMAFIGTTGDNSTPGGPLNSSNPRLLVKPAATIVKKLLALNDPRLQRWVNPVLYKWDVNTATDLSTPVKNVFGDSYTVKYRPAAPNSADTSLYVGLPVGLSTVDAQVYNKGNDNGAYNPERNPYISYLHDRYRVNADTYVKVKLMTYAEVQFLLAEAALTGGFTVSSSADQYYKNGIQASMDRWGVTGKAAGFDFNTYYGNPDIDYAGATDKLARIMEQKWIAGWLSIEPWFDWRRTGYPDLQTGPVAQFGPKLPIRFIYPSPNLDKNYLVNYQAAVDRLEATIYVPVGQAADHSYSKMWLLQGTGKPW